MPDQLPLSKPLWVSPDGSAMGKAYEPFHVKYPEKAIAAVRQNQANNN